ncbi:hypothetical protein [Pseudoflavitalea rhizosphaerae]|uniref:hypothetical protein n=1 Tax=Pseudoflavitalea rhizosphaerae TaxID=1884793 RepID=UPI000F8DE8DB|nr:hypothetical protein [Pseudoflavitalea rhizosphaerae]
MRFPALTKRSIALLAATLILFTACKITLLSTYDQVTDNVLSEMQQSTTAFFVRYETTPSAPELKYQNQQAFYQGLMTSSRTLRIRNSAVEKNRPMITMLDLLDENILLMDSLHKQKPDGLLAPHDVRLLKSAFESQYTAMFKFVMALKSRAAAQ